jgi:hypothetical protein
VLEKFEQEYPGIKDKKEAEIESTFKKFCKTLKNSKEDRFVSIMIIDACFNVS